MGFFLAGCLTPRSLAFVFWRDLFGIGLLWSCLVGLGLFGCAYLDLSAEVSSCPPDQLPTCHPLVININTRERKGQ